MFKSDLYRYLVDNRSLSAAESSFRRYISSVPEFDSYFKNQKCISIGGPSLSRFETGMGEQAQLDWKESIEFKLSTGESIIINIFVLILSFSRFRIYRMSIDETQDILFSFMDYSFQCFGGVPKEILTDNMKTVMDQARTEYSAGKINTKFKQFADDYGFKVHPCIAGRPETKAKVESPMRILDEIRAYSGELDLTGLQKKIEDINNRENTRLHKSYLGVPITDLEKEKDFLNPLPTDKIRSQYQLVTKTVKVNRSSMITYKNNLYSVPPEYLDKNLQLQVYDNHLHLYYSTKLVAVHKISDKKLNYIENHYIEILNRNLKYKNKEDIEAVAKENLKKIGERYENRS